MLRKALFWTHLASGVVCGAVILVMSATGVLLAYERQIVAWAQSPMHHPVAATSAEAPLPVAAWLAAVAAHDPEFAPTAIAITADPTAPAEISAGRSGRYFVDRYDGRVVTDSAADVRAMFGLITAWHRWLAAEGENRDVARAITGASNLAFLFLLLSGAYLWLPPIFNRTALRVRALINPRARSGRARDYNWHHVFGAWTVLPLIVIVASAVVFSYDWANRLLYRAVGDTPPARGAPGRPAPPATAAGSDTVAFDALFAAAALAAPGWRQLSLALPGAGDSEVRMTADLGTGGQPQHRVSLVLDAATGAVLAEEPFAALPAGQRARSWVRFLHTGEAYGLPGQTVAGLVSLTTVVMVWTGVALAWRRLVSPLIRRRRLAAEGR